VKQETRLFLDAAAADDDVEAKSLAREGRRLMLERQARWLVGDDAYLGEAEEKKLIAMIGPRKRLTTPNQVRSHGTNGKSLPIHPKVQSRVFRRR
jgi:hypothetical protein